MFSPAMRWGVQSVDVERLVCLSSIEIVPKCLIDTNIFTLQETEASSLQKEIEQLKEEVSSQGIKVKWAQNKLKTELDSHKVSFHAVELFL